MVHLLLVSLDKLVVLIHIDVAEFAHLFLLACRPTVLYAKVFVHLCLDDAQFVLVSLCCHSESSVTLCASVESCPEVREAVDDGGIVSYSTSRVTGAVEQQRTVIQRHNVVGLVFQYEVEVVDGSVVVAHLYAQLSSVIVRHEVLGVQFEGFVVVSHSSAKIVSVIPYEGSVYVERRAIRLQVDSLRELAVGIFPLVSAAADDSTYRPSLAVVGVYLQRLVKILGSPDGIFLTQQHLCLQLVGFGIVLPAQHHRVQIVVGSGIVFLFDTAEHAVVPQSLTQRVEFYGLVVVADGTTEVLLTDTTESAELVDARHVGVQRQSLGAVALGA